MAQTAGIKLSLIEQIMATNDAAELRKIDSAIKNIQLHAEPLSRLARPTRKRLDIEELKKEQDFRPISKKKFHEKMDQLTWEESVEDLLKMI